MIAVSVDEMKKLESFSIKNLNIPSILLMENAASGFVSSLKSEIGNLDGKEICVICGKGNNGGDGYAIARHLFFLGASVSIFSVCDIDSLTGDAKTNCDIAKAMGIPFCDALKKYDIIVDAIFGTGFCGDVADDVANVIDFINESGAFVASVDVPSGLSSQNGQGSKFVCADLCVTFGYAKCGLFLYPARSAYKKLVVAPISIPKPCNSYSVITSKTFCEIPKRASNSHKGTFGKALAFVGSQGMAGAAILSGSAILKSGTGMATVATADELIPTLAHQFPSVMTFPVPTVNGELCDNSAELILKKAKEMNAALIGCGLGKSKSTKNTVNSLIKALDIPTVIDADGLNILSENIDILNEKKAELILTPHIVEFSRLSGYSVAEIKENPIGLSCEFAQKYGVTLILKDAVTVIAGKDEKIAICPAENSGMATAGSGDVLAGIVTSFLSQGMESFDAAKLSVYIHAAAGRLAVDSLGEHGMTSTDILNNVPMAFLDPVDITPLIKEL